jgi:Rap1a immunity proteins
MFKIYTNSATHDKEVIFCLEFVSGVARQLFTNRLALKDIKTSRDLIMMSIPSACPTSFVSNGAMVQAFSEWAKRHPEEWRATAQIGVMQAVRDTWPCP